ncbi:MAG: divalent cation tolerance protein CutA [Halobacteria archaeon]
MSSKGNNNGEMKLVYTTAKRRDANRMAKMLVNEGLAACINMFAIKSIYRWKGKIEEGHEIAMFIKTGKPKHVIKRIREIHPYELPAILTFNARSYKEFEAWLKVK